jgi:protein arginine kinase
VTESLFASRWYDGGGKDMDVVLSSRARLARNLVDYPFPGRMARDDENAVSARVLDSVARSREGGDLEPVDVSGLSAIERRVLVEEGVVSQAYSLEPFRRFAMTMDGSLTVVPNDVDHVRISAFAPGLNLKSPMERAEVLDDLLEESLPYAATYELGYLATELNSLGTGLRLSFLLHLPALSDTGLIEKAMKGVLSEGLAVRGFYGGEGQSSGALYQVSNAASLGDSESAQAERIEAAARRIVQYERMAREELAEKDKERLLDKVARAYALMVHARVVQLNECFELLSSFRLGVALGWIQGTGLAEVDGLYFRLQKASLQMRLGSADDSERGADVDSVRAGKLRAFAKACALAGES